ncbi:hypothetical protein KQX54_020779 [Cotesia glomerata]|uniref:Uncharacterized protein n=1 Tax=Cotesia glomerata TaxID=32391 RepID=A0AAV7HZX2_COTGL|nr:hypothetical protein KQX54_020779 [Cotesia glomerata]
MCECLQNVSVTFPMTTSDLSFRNWSYSSLARNVSKTRFRDFRRKSGYETIPDDDRQIEMTFHNVDESYSIVEVERNLRVDNLCELLRIKNQFKPSDWRIVETWPKLDVTIERVLENHEDIYVVHREGERFEGSEDRRFVFKLVSDDIEDYVNNPRTSFPEDMVLKIKDEEELNRGEHLADRDERLAQTLPKLCDTVWVADKDNINVWKAVLMVLTDRKLYLIERMLRKACIWAFNHLHEAVNSGLLHHEVPLALPRAIIFVVLKFNGNAIVNPLIYSQ